MNSDIDSLFDFIVERVKYERKKRGISQLKLAYILDFQSPNYIAKIETRKHNVNYNLVHLYKIAHAFDMNIKDFLP